MPLSYQLLWAVERGEHRRDDLVAGAEALLRRYHRIAELPQVLKMRRERKKKELERAAQAALGKRGRR